MLDLILNYWYLVPTVMAIASIIAKATPNQTDDKFLAMIQKIIDIIAFSSEPTKLRVIETKLEIKK